MDKCPCEECILFVLCKIKLYSYREDVRSATELAWKQKCKNLLYFVEHGDQDDLNNCRVLFGLKAIK
jgi:hypothetical protein